MHIELLHQATSKHHFIGLRFHQAPEVAKREHHLPTTRAARFGAHGHILIYLTQFLRDLAIPWAVGSYSLHRQGKTYYVTMVKPNATRPEKVGPDPSRWQGYRELPSRNHIPALTISTQKRTTQGYLNKAAMASIGTQMQAVKLECRTGSQGQTLEFHFLDRWVPGTQRLLHKASGAGAYFPLRRFLKRQNLTLKKKRYQIHEREGTFYVSL